MKKVFIITILVFHSLIHFGQDARKILEKSYKKCQSVQNGYYEMVQYKKYMTERDTFKTSFNCYFKKLKEDTLFPCSFHYQKYFNDKYFNDALYSGKELVWTNLADSSATILSKNMWSKEIKSWSYNYEFFTPLVSKELNPIKLNLQLEKEDLTLKIIGEELVNENNCFHIRVNQLPKYDSINSIQDLRVEYNFWVDKKSYLPLQYSIAFDMVWDNDTMYQYEKLTLNKLVLNMPMDTNTTSIESIPSYYKLKDYVPVKSQKQLPKKILAPEWKLVSLEDDSISLVDLRGNIVLIDFFYKSCFPCLKALPHLQILHEKYKDQGLVLIGIDPFDKKEDYIVEFLSKRGITYTILLSDKDVAKEYNVSGYPTVYLIDREGKIIDSIIGYGEGVEKEIEEIILNNL